MKNLLLVFIFCFAAVSIIAQETASITELPPSKENTIIVNIEDIESTDGAIYLGLYDSKEDWLNKNIQSVKGIIDGSKSIATFENVPAGIYAVSIYHDQNSDGKLDTGFFGIPTEPYASSNGAVGRFGPPAWEDAKFKVENSTTEIVIKF